MSTNARELIKEAAAKSQEYGVSDQIRSNQAIALAITAHAAAILEIAAALRSRT